jgi:hypothetical protein
MTLLSALASVDDEQPTAVGSAALDQIVDQGRVVAQYAGPSIWMAGRLSLDKSDAIHSASRSVAQTSARPRFRDAVPGHDRQVAFGKPGSFPELTCGHVDFRL